MNIPHATISGQPKIGLCPHGMPHGACPICSGMGGGGGAKQRVTKPAGEMSWDECYSEWQQMLRAKDLAMKSKSEIVPPTVPISISSSGKLNNVPSRMEFLIDKLSAFSQKSQLNQVLAKPLLIIAKLAVPVLNVVRDVVAVVQKAFSSVSNFVQQKFADISDKLSAIFGEIKNFKEKKISDKLKDFKKKFNSIFQINEPEKIDDEDKKLEEVQKGSKK